MTRIMTAVALAVALHLAGMHSNVQGGYIAQAGFNDALGINSNPTPNSPYTLGGAVAGAGGGESG